MKLKLEMWEPLKTYLFIDRKLSSKPSSAQANKSRFLKLASYFSSVEFNRANFNLFIGEMKSQGYTNSYINKMITIAKHIDAFYKLNELQDYTYFREVRKPTLDVLTPDEIEAMANVTVPYRNNADYINQRQKALILLLGLTGCRIGEALSLQYSDIHATPSYVIFRDTKNGEDRIVPISQKLYDLLMNLPKKNGYVFPSRRGGLLELQQVNLDIKRRAEMVGIKKSVWCHLFRHSYITTMLESGVDALHVAHLVGHKDLKNTMRYSNSSLSFYYDIIHFHPLLRGSMTWEKVTEKLKQAVTKIVDIKVHALRINERNDKLVIEVEKQR